MTRAEFIKTIAPIIQNEAMKRGYKYPSAIIAQACLESGYGQSGLAKYNNFFGLKCGSTWKGASVNMTTKEEYKPGQLTTIKDYFRAYSTMSDGVKGYFDFIATARYSNLKQATSPRDYLEKIKADGYATSSSYANNVYNVLISNSLSIYDNYSMPSWEHVLLRTTANLNIRDGKSTNAKIIDTIPKDTEICADRWIKVLYNGKEGYCSMEFLKKV